MKFIELANEVMKLREEQGVRGLDRELSRFRCHVASAHFAEKPIDKIGAPDIREWLRVMSQKTVPGKGHKLSRHTVNRCQSLVSAVFTEAVERELIQANPCTGVRAKKRVDENDTKEKWAYLTADEQKAIAACAEIPIEDRLLIRFAIATGLRQGELFHLQVDDLKFDGPDPHIVVRVGSRSKSGKALPPKSGKRRIVPLLPEGLSVTREWLALLPTFAPSSPHGLVFPQTNGKHRQQGKPFGRSDTFKKYLALVGITRRVRFHDLRHTCATNLITGVVGRRWTMEEVQVVMGHSSVTVTQRYSHLGEDALKRAANETRQATAETPKEIPLQPNARELAMKALRGCVWFVKGVAREVKKHVA